MYNNRLKSRFAICGFIMFVIAVIPRVGMAQESSTSEVETIKMPMVDLPPIGELIQAAAVRAPYAHYHRERAEMERLAEKSVKREILKYIKIQGGYKYGMTDDRYNQSASDVQLYRSYHSKMEHWASIGVVVDLPILEFVDRKNRLKQQRMKVKQAISEAEREEVLIGEKVITFYNDVLLHMSILRIKSESLEVNNAQMRMSKNDFIQGRIDIGEFTRLKNLQVLASIDYQNSRAMLNNAVMQLEHLTGVIIKKDF